jgi:hypothetical protein
MLTGVITVLATSAALCGCHSTSQPLTVEAERIRLHPIVARDTVKPAGVPADFVATPVGYFHPSCLVHVDANESVASRRSSVACAYQHYDVTGKLMGAAGETRAPAPAPSESRRAPAVAPRDVTKDLEGWTINVNSSWNAGVSKLSADWTVPPTPPQSSGQVLFWFPGTQSLDGKPNGTIIQPVLAYEFNHWFVQSWNCCEGGNNAEYGDAVNVSPGDIIYGENAGSNCNPSTGICDNWRITTKDTTNGGASVFDTVSFGHPHQWIFGNVLEVYGVNACAELPDSGRLTNQHFSLWDVWGNFIDVTSMAWDGGASQWLANCGGPWSAWQSGTDFTVDWGGPRGRSVAIISALSGKCLDINGAGTADGTKAQEWTCNRSGAQRFHLVDAGNGASSIVNDNSGKCLDINGAFTDDGTVAQLWTCNGGNNQAFTQVDAGQGYVQLVSVNSGKCLDINGAFTDDGTQVHQWSCNGGSNQAWYLQAW